MTDLADLKRKAEAAREAAPEEWQTISYEGKSPSGKKHQYSVCSEDFDMSGHICIGTVLVDEDGDTRLPDFVAAANPSTILELLARLEAAEKVIAEQIRGTGGPMVGGQCSRCGALECLPICRECCVAMDAEFAALPPPPEGTL